MERLFLCRRGRLRLPAAASNTVLSCEVDIVPGIDKQGGYNE